MDADRWERMETLFSEAVELPPAEREAFLEGACGGDGGLRAEVAAMLAADAGELALLVEAHLPGGAQPETLAGRAVGPYRLEALIAHGGMGEVYRAWRDDGHFRQRVALKLVRPGTGHDDARLRFHAERQILAALEHPNIARVFDGGVAPDGRPFLVMEYVEGEPIVAYCDRRRLTVDARLRLFQKVCAAVQHAHRNLVVHRDLKPGNILVTPEGEPKLLDFGIAKLLEPGAAGATAVETRSGVRVMTPAYAAPEQVRGEPVTTATDVYALGVLLYELLTGRYPYRLPETGTPAVERAVLEQEPARPSTAVLRAAPALRRPDGAPDALTPATAGEARAARPEKLSRRLAGDLDTIVLTALRKEPERRYASAEALLEDIRRHQAGLPVRARKDGRAYRAGKFIRRHRIGVLTAAGVALLLLSFAAIYARGIQQEKRVAQREAERARLMAGIMEELFRTADPYTRAAPRGDSLLLVLGRQKVEQELAGEPDLQIRLLTTLGRLYVRRGTYEQARPLLEQALSIARATYPQPHPALADVLKELGDFHLERRAYGPAKRFYGEMIAVRRALHGADHPAVFVALSQMARLESFLGDPVEAERMHRQVVALSRRIHDTGDEAYPIGVWNLARALYLRGKFGEAEQALLEVLALRRRRFGDEHAEVAETLQWLGLVLTDKGDFAASRRYLQQALALQHRLFGPEHSEVAESLFGLGLLEKEQARYAPAAAYLEESIAMSRRIFGAQHEDVIARMQVLGEVYRQTGAYDRARLVLEAAAGLARRLLGRDHTEVGATLAYLGRALSDAGDYAAAESVFREALAIRTRDDARGNLCRSSARAGYGELLTRMGRAEAAEPLLREAVSTLSAGTVSPHNRHLLHAREALAACLAAQRRPAEAAPILEELYRTYRGHYGPEDPRARNARALLLALPGR